MLLAIVHFYKPSPSEPLPWSLLPAGRSGRQHWDTTAGVSREQLSLMMKASQKKTSQIQTILLNFKKKLLPLIGRDEHRNTRHCSILTLQFSAIINRLYILLGWITSVLACLTSRIGLWQMTNNVALGIKRSKLAAIKIKH